MLVQSTYFYTKSWTVKPGKTERFQRSLYRFRTRLLPQVPRKEDDLKEMDIAERYKVTSSQERFLILNTAGEE